MITFLIISMILYIIVYKSIGLIHKNKYLNKLKDTRKYLSDQEILAFYTNSKLSEISILELWNEVATNFDVPPGYLRPEDRLAKMGILQIVVDHPKLESLNDIVIERKKTLNRPIDLESISTLDDYIKAFALKA
jgi:heme oxygenase